MYQQSVEWVDFARQQPSYKPLTPKTSEGTVKQVETAVEKNDNDQTLTIKTRPIKNQVDVDASRLSPNFLYVYKSVTSVLRDHGLI